LADDVYVGTWVWPKNPEGKYYHATAEGIIEGPNRQKARGYRTCANPLVIENNHKALVSKEVFDRCQRVLGERQRNTSPYHATKTIYRLAGLLKCGHCGASMVGILCNYREHPEWRNRSYLCSNYHQKGLEACQRHYVQEEPMLEVLVHKLQEKVLCPDRLGALRKEIRRQLKPPKVRRENPRRLKAQIEALSKKLDQGVENLLEAPKDLTALLTAKLQEWRRERDALRAQLEILQQPQKAASADLDAMVDRAIGELETLGQRLHEADPVLLRQALREMISKVELWFRRVRKLKTERSELVRGLIHLRPELKSVKLVSGVSTLGKS